MASERETALAQIVSLADKHGIAADEIVKHMAVVKTASRQGSIVKTLLGYTGGTFVFAGIGLLVSMIWEDIGAGQRVVITLGSGIVAFIIAMLCHRDVRYEKAVIPLLLVAALMQPTGLFVFLDEFVPKTGDPVLAVLIVFATVAIQQGLAFLQHQQRYQSDWSGLFAAIVIVMLPTLTVYAIFQNQIQRGLTIGALKG